MPQLVILDTNVLVYCVKHRTSLETIRERLSASELVIPTGILEELGRHLPSIMLEELLKHLRIEHSDTTGDSAIIEVALRLRARVLTTDHKLQISLRAADLRVVSFNRQMVVRD